MAAILIGKAIPDMGFRVTECPQCGQRNVWLRWKGSLKLWHEEVKNIVLDGNPHKL